MILPILLAAAFSLSFHDPASAPHDHAPKGAGDQEWKRAPRPEAPVFVGQGAQRYRWDSEWLKLPAGRAWLGSTHGCIVVDGRDRVYLSAESGPAVLVFAPDGTLERSFGEELGAGLHGLAIVRESFRPEGAADPELREVLYLVHTGRQEVLKLTLEGELLLRIPPPSASGKYADPSHYRPTSVAVAPSGEIFVADGYGLSWIHRFNAKGEYEASFGGRGESPANLHTPHGLWLDTLGDRPTLLVADRENHRLARFALSGEYLGGTDPAAGLLRRPCHVQFQGELAVVSDLEGRVTLLDARLELIAHLGDNPDPAQRAQYGIPPELWRDGAFLAPHCARFNSKGDILVMDWNVAGRVTRLVHAPESPAPK